MLARRLKLPVTAVGCVLAGVVGLMVAPALAAAALVAPVERYVSERTPETIGLFGILNTGSETEGGSEAGTYEFLYKESASGECEGADHSLQGLWSGSQSQRAEGTLSGLKPGTSYAVCLRVENGKAEKATSVPLTIITAIAPEVPTGEEAKSIATGGVTLRGVLNSGAERKIEPGNYEFVYSQSSSECEGPEQKTTPSVRPSGAKDEIVQASVSEVLPNTQYTFCLRFGNEAAPTSESVLGAPVTFTTPTAAPKIEAEFTSDVASTSATLDATIDPGGAESSYTFEYAPVGAAFTPVAETGGAGSIPEGTAGTSVDVHVQQGLLPGLSYEFRVVVRNRVGSVTGEGVSFTTQLAETELALPDGRQYEMVSPLQKEGTLFGHIEEGIVQAAADGNAFTDWSSFEPLEDNAAGAYGFNEANFFGRGPGGWVSKTITPPHSARGEVPLYEGQEYRFFSEDLSEAILQPFGPATPLAPGVSESTPYIHTNYLNGNPGELCGSNCFQPLVSEANVPVGAEYGEEGGKLCTRIICGPEVLAVSPDLSHVLISTGVALTAGFSGGIYEWTGGKLTFVTTGSVDAVTNAGSLVISGSYEGTEGLLLHDATTGETIRLDVPQGSGLPPAPPGQASFQAASTDDSRVFFTSGQPLTKDATEPALYEYNLNAPVGTRLTDISVDDNSGEAAGVSTVIGASQDGSYVYFAASGVLAPGASPATCSAGVSVCMNLYVRHDGTTTFVAGLGGEDSPDWASFESEGNRFTARVSPNGRWLAFMSNRDLTGYDTADAVSGHPDEEVYLYDASADKVVCASCNSTGARPVGVEYGEDSEAALTKSLDVFPGSTWIAANVPPWTEFDNAHADYQSRYLSDSGRLFFDSNDALAPQDVNGTQDVYEYEPPGVGACSSGALTFSERSDGCVSLISSGESAEESAFLDASETGGDVFFLTPAKLVSHDTDNAYDIYDARECGSPSRCMAPAPVSPPPCDTGDACKPAPTPQPAIFGSPSSATFSGAGNLTPIEAPAVKAKALTRAQRLARALRGCRGKKGKRRRTCERQARTRYGAKKAHKANASKRSGR